MPSADLAVGAANHAYTWPFGRKNRWSRFMLAAFVLVVLIATGFKPEIRALLWHAQHGKTFDLHGVRFRIPRLAYVQHIGWTEDLWEVRFENGWIRSAFGGQHRVYSLQYLPGELMTKVVAGQDALVQRQEYGLVAKHRTAMVGTMLLCTEFLDTRTQGHHVICERTTSGPLPQYAGPADGVPDFYRFIASATSVAAPTTADAP